MIRANRTDKALVVELLTRAFDANKSVNYILKQDHCLVQRIRSLMDYAFEVCSLFGEVYISNDRKGCALLLYPRQKRTTLRSLWLDIRLVFRAVGFSNVSKTMTREARIKSLQPAVDMLYLWFIGVDPSSQHSGVGSQLLMEITGLADQKKLPVYLETSTAENIPWYTRHGFVQYDTLELGYPLSLLRRPPNTH